MSTSAELAEGLVAGDVRCLARAISLVEENAPGSIELLRLAFPRSGRATVLGITGPPGAGKSSLVDRLIESYRAEGAKVGVVAVDPSSAYSGGAILGDRIRMQRHATDPGVFIRSMAGRGHLGGLSRATHDAVDLLETAGYGPILVETIGVGQDEIDVARVADVVAVVLVPGMGDDIQAIKAGILEIADLFVINKADKPGADRLASDLAHMLSMAPDEGKPKPEICFTVAVDGTGVRELREKILTFQETSGRERGDHRRRERAEERFLSILRERLVKRVLTSALSKKDLQVLLDRIARRELDPYTAAERVLERVEVR